MLICKSFTAFYVLYQMTQIVENIRENPHNLRDFYLCAENCVCGFQDKPIMKDNLVNC